MNIPAHFKFLLDSVEVTARQTDAVLHHDNLHMWDDIMDSFEERHERPNYWIFCTRWMREELLKVMHRGSPRALLAILSVLRPKDAPAPNHKGTPSTAMRRRVVAMLLPVMMAELAVRARNATTERLGPYSAEPEVYHPEDHRD